MSKVDSNCNTMVQKHGKILLCQAEILLRLLLAMHEKIVILIIYCLVPVSNIGIPVKNHYMFSLRVLKLFNYVY